jgi:hypothetical protein
MEIMKYKFVIYSISIIYYFYVNQMLVYNKSSNDV